MNPSLIGKEPFRMNSNTNSNISRRRFLKGTALAATSAFAVPTIIPRHVLGSATAPGANDQIVVGSSGWECAETNWS